MLRQLLEVCNSSSGCRGIFAMAAGRTVQAGDAGAAGGAPHDHAPSARPGWAQGRGSRQRRRHADPAFWVGGQSQHTSALPGAGRRVPAQRRRCAAVRRSSRANRRSAAGGVAQDHHPIDASCSPVGACWSKRRKVRLASPTTTAIRTRPARSGRCRWRRVLTASLSVPGPGRRC